MQPDAYREFLEAKVEVAAAVGFGDREMPTHPWLRPHVDAACRWMLAGGRRAVFASFGLHKTVMQLWACHVALSWIGPGARGLLVVPLGVRQEFYRDAARLGIEVKFVRTTLECWGPGLYLTNYESVREGKIDVGGFDVVSLDEAACLRGMGGTKTFRVLAQALAQVPYRFLATATPSPNEFVELLAYAEVLGIMDAGQAKTRFFQRNSEQANDLTLMPHMEDQFWLWVSSWALFISKPSDLGFDDAGYVLPPMRVRWHEVEVAADFDKVDVGRDGQPQLFKDVKIGVATQAREKRSSLLARVAKAQDICRRDPAAHRILWHDLNDERDLIVQALPDAFVLDGSQADEVKEQRLLGFADGFFQYLAAKPVMAGAGCNFQRHCHKAVFVGVGFKFHDFIQAIHRIYRFGQTAVVEIDIVYSANERGVRQELERKWSQHNQMVEKMTDIVRQYGLSSEAMVETLKRSMGVERLVASGKRFDLVHADCVLETAEMADDSVDLIVSSIPFSNLYEYSPNYADFGHSRTAAHFWQQMDFLIPNLLRVLKPGRDACIHVKDRILSGNMTGMGFQTLESFSDECRARFKAHGFAYLGTIYLITDVVRENNQTYRLGHSEQLKDGTRQGVGVPEQIILLRKLPTDLSNGYADDRVEKPRPQYRDRSGRVVAYDREREKDGDIFPIAGTGYSRARWQLDASSFWRSDGDRLLHPDEWLNWDNLGEAQRIWRLFNLENLYSFEQHVAVGEAFEAIGMLPSKFGALPAASWHPEVWTDILQMRSLNTIAYQQGEEKHLCPLPFDIVNRLILQRSEPGELVFDPFAGLGTVPYCALKNDRRGLGVELAPKYWAAAAKTLGALDAEAGPEPTLFDMLALRGEPTEEAA